MTRHFDKELRKLKESLLKMSVLVEESISKSIKSLVNRKSTLADAVIKSDEAINLLEIDIDKLCLKLIALYQPAAIDLRYITSAMKINSQLERIGDQAVNIAKRAKRIIKKPELKPLIDIPHMATLSQQMLKNSLDALTNKDAKLARSVCKSDDEVDNLNDQVFRELITYMIDDPKTIKRALEHILIGRHLERIAD
ncbi:phosphate signaling complex protein PhoU, partial [Thermodesulfobacteriota bacterium]